MGGEAAPARFARVIVLVRRVYERQPDVHRRLHGTGPVDEVINETLYHERRRLQRVKNAPRLDGDKTFIAALGHELPHAGDARQRAMVHEIVTHYAQEIRGHFDPRVYEVATRALPLSVSVAVALALGTPGTSCAK